MFRGHVLIIRRNKLIVKKKVCASSWLITEINVQERVTLLTNFSANADFSLFFWTRLTNMDSANECFSGCAR